MRIVSSCTATQPRRARGERFSARTWHHGRRALILRRAPERPSSCGSTAWPPRPGMAAALYRPQLLSTPAACAYLEEISRNIPIFQGNTREINKRNLPSLQRKWTLGPRRSSTRRRGGTVLPPTHFLAQRGVELSTIGVAYLARLYTIEAMLSAAVPAERSVRAAATA